MCYPVRFASFQRSADEQQKRWDKRQTQQPSVNMDFSSFAFYWTQQQNKNIKSNCKILFLFLLAGPMRPIKPYAPRAIQLLYSFIVVVCFAVVVVVGWCYYFITWNVHATVTDFSLILALCSRILYARWMKWTRWATVLYVILYTESGCNVTSGHEYAIHTNTQNNRGIWL